MADYENLLDSIDAVIRSNNRREITGQILQNTLHQMVASLGENYQLAGFATPTLDPNSPDENVFYITDEAGVYTNFDNITLGAGLSFLMWKNEEWTSKTLDIVTADWVDEHYVSKAFLRKVFQFFDEDGVEIFPNDTESVVDNIKAMCGLWTNEYLSALGLGEGSTIPTTLAALNDVTITNPQDGQALVYDLASSHWVNRTIQSGVDMSVVWAALAAATNEQINISHLTTALNDYVTATSLATTLQSYVTTSALATELASYASQSWVETNYVSKAFFNSLFEAQDVNGNAITPNNSGQTTIDRLKILVGAYTEQYLSALGLSSGGGGGGSSTLAGLNDVTITNPQDGQALIYDAQSSHWVNGAAISMSAVWTALAAATSEQINSSHLTSALSGYVTTSALASELANYVTTSSLATTLADYVTTSALTTTLADYGSKTWIDNNYVSKAFFNRLFQAFAPLAEGQTEPTQVEPNDTTTTIDNIKAMFGLWTEQYLSALGLSSDAGHSIGVLDDLNDVTITNPQTNQVLTYNGTQWVNAAAPSGASALSGLTDVAISSLADKDLLQWDYATGKWKNVVLSTAMSAYALASSIPTNVSQLNNDSGYITSAELSGYATENWVGNNYLHLSGGTLNSTSRNILTLHQTNTGSNMGPYIHFSLNNGLKGAIGYNNSKGIFIENYVNGTVKGLWIEDGGNLTYQDNIILDAGNYTSYLGYIGTTAVQASSAVQSLTGIGNIESANFRLGTGISFSTRSALLINSPATKPADLIFRSGTFTTGAWGDWAISSRSTEGSVTEQNSFVISRGVQNEGVGSENICFKIGSNTKVIIGSGILNTSATAQLHVVGDIYSTLGFKKANASDTDVLLGGGGHAAISGLSVSYASNAGNATYATSAGTATDNTKILKTSDTFSGTHTYTGSSHIFETAGSDTTTIFKYTGSGTPVPFKISDSSTNISSGTDSDSYGTLHIERLNTSNGYNNAGSSIYFCLKNASGSSEEAAGISGINTQNGKLIFRGRNRAEIGSIDSSLLSVVGNVKANGFWAGTGHIAGRAGIRINSTGTAYPTDILLGHTDNYIQWSDVYWALSARGSGENYRFSIWRGNALTSENELFVLTRDLNVGIGTTSPSYKLHVVGDIYATGGVTCLSDIRKKDVTGYNLPLTVDQIAAAPTIKFTWKDKREEGEQVGTIAQYWQNVLPWVIKDKSGELSMQYGVAALISSITIARKVVDHEQRITELERENADLKQAYSFIKNAYDYLKMDYENLKQKIA